MIEIKKIELPYFGKIQIFNEKKPNSNTVHVISSTMIHEDYIAKIFKIIKWYKEKWNMPWDIFVLNDGLNVPVIEELIKETDCIVISFEEHLGRKSIHDYPYEWRNLYYINNILKEYDKVLFMANDFYILKKEMIDFINNFNQGWAAFWSNGYGWPESACQIINKNCSNYTNFINSGNFHERSPHIQYELQAPFTNIIKNFKGCRYGEYLHSHELTPDMDYWGQAKLEDIFEV
jgi:hypothetical protein